MSIIIRQEEIDNRWLTWIPYNGLDCLLLENDHQLTEEEAQLKLEEWQASQVVEEPNGTPE